MINFFKKLLPHKKIDENHYGKFIGSFNFLRILSWNIFHIRRILNRILWKTLIQNKKYKIKKYNVKLGGVKRKISSDKLDFFLENGGVLIQNFFTDVEIINFLNEYENLLAKEKSKNHSNKENTISVYNKIRLNLSKPLLDIWLNKEVIEFVKSFLGTEKIYAREYPRLVHTKYMHDNILTSQNKEKGIYKNLTIDGPYFWHTDHTAGLVNFHILLEDVDKLTSTHMQFLPGSNKFLNSRDLYSDETVNNFMNKPIDCIGKKGTIYFHQGNTLHRVVGKKNSERLSLIFSISKGAGIEFNSKLILNLLSGEYDIDSLTTEKRDILSGIAPYGQMIEIKKNILRSPIFKEN